MFRFVIVGLMFCASIFALTLGGASAGPFRQRCRNGSCSPALREEICQPINDPEFTTPLPESKEETPPVPQPWLETWEEVGTSSLQQDIVLEPIPGTGSKLGIGAKVPDKITHTLDKETVDKLTALLSQGKQPVTIDVPILPETSQRLSRISMLLEWLLWLGGAMFGGSAVGKVLPLVARLGAGLQSATSAMSQAPATIPAAPSYYPPNPLPGVNPAVPSSTRTPGT